MKEEFVQLPLINNEVASRFEMTVDGYIAYIEYEIRDRMMALVHTISPKEVGGRGVATALIEKVLQYFKERNEQFIPECPMIIGYIKKHPEWRDFVPAIYHSKFEE